MDRLKELVCLCGAGKAEAIKFADCEIINRRLIEKLSFAPKSVLVGVVPYYTRHCDLPHTVSAYALAHDYHIFIKKLCERIISEAQKEYPDSHFAWFGDHSPINEKLAAAKAGLGVIGEHSLLITPEFSSFVFLFEIFTDIECYVDAKEVMSCEKCGKCVAACPVNIFDKSSCLSAITQKKGELNENEKILIKASGCVWGCDICQTVCPHTTEAKRVGSIYSDIDWFNYNIISSPTQESVRNSSDFSLRAYSWRGAATILRNINILNDKYENEI